MAKVALPEADPIVRVERECPACHANIFQGPFNRGPLVNDALEVRETLYQCVNCNRVFALADLPVRVSLAGNL